jgi:S-DNA-T family DNA segregation ATPase FtsK/SpoIIIE
MGRKKKEIIDAENKKKDRAVTQKRELIGLIFLAVALLILFSVFGSAGIFGQYFNQVLTFLIGWTAYLLPFLAIIYIYQLLRGREVSLNIILGTVFVILALSSIFSLLNLDQGLSFVTAGNGGGVIGYGLAYILNSLLAFWPVLIILLLWLVAGSLMYFNVSFASLFSRNKNPEEEPMMGDEAVTAEAGESEHGMSIFNWRRRKVETEVETPQATEAGQLKVSDSSWAFPPLDLLGNEEKEAKVGNVEKKSEIIKKTLGDYGIEVAMGEVNIGPTVTQFTLKPKTGTKLNNIVSRSEEIAYALAAHPIRIEAPIPGKSAVGIEVPNQEAAVVRLRKILESKEYEQEKSLLAVPMGKDVSGKTYVTELTRMPHLLVAGSTGSGKSVFLNSMLLTFLYSNSPKTLRMILVDPKRVEFTLYNDLPHLLSPVITEVDKTISALRWATEEMDRRYILLQEHGKRNILDYNRSVSSDKKLSYILIMVDELADLMTQAKREVEASIVRLTQMARATGIHLVLATQRPSTDVITGLIKANITNRVAFQVASQIDSRTILDHAGAEKLLGRGDMLFQSADSSKPKRIQGPRVTEEEIRRVTSFLKDREKPNYDETVTQVRGGGFGINGDSDELLEQAAEVIIQSNKASASLLQRRMRVGYARAARLVDMLEEKGVVGPQEGSRPRRVLVDQDTFNQMKEKGFLN